MMFLFDTLATEAFGFLLLLFGSEGVSFGIYETKKSLTPLGWAVIISFPAAAIFGAIFLAIKILRKPKIK